MIQRADGYGYRTLLVSNTGPLPSGKSHPSTSLSALPHLLRVPREEAMPSTSALPQPQAMLPGAWHCSHAMFLYSVRAPRLVPWLRGEERGHTALGPWPEAVAVGTTSPVFRNKAVGRRGQSQDQPSSEALAESSVPVAWDAETERGQ